MSEAPGPRAGLSHLLPSGLAFRLRRLAYLISRGLLSLRTRGLSATLQRVGNEFTPADPAARAQLVFPEAHETAPPVFTPSPQPRASVIVPVYGQLAMTLDCLAALALHSGEVEMEVIVVDDASTDDTPRVLPGIEGLRYQRMPANAGFIAACNEGARLARGEFLVFLNNDTLVQPGWLQALLDTFTTHPDTGLAGAMLVYPDGRLQEAGGLVFADGSGWNLGRFDSPGDPRHGYVREVDYCSGAAIAVAAELFQRLGGFDSHYAPAYYEDTDLAMRVRAAGLKVRYQPASVVVHREGATSGTDLASGTKAYQRVNQKKFQARWDEVLQSEHAVPGTEPLAASRRHRRGQVLVIDVQVPKPDRDSGSLRMLNLLRLLLERGLHVVFLPDSREREGRYATALEQLGVEVWSRAWLGDMPKWFARHGARFDLVITSRHYVAASYEPLLRKHAPRARWVFDTVDLHFLREQREAEMGRGSLRLAQRTREQELRLMARADATLVVSTHEYSLLGELLPAARVEVLSNVHEIAGCRRGFNDRRDLVFVGGFRHPPNVDAARWLVGEIWPRVRERLPGVELHLVGGDVGDDIRVLGDSPGVHVRGHVPDIAPLMDGCRLALAPLRYGAGVKGKVNLSMAHGQPVVATSCGVEGMHLETGVDVLVADDAEGFADAIVGAYTDQATWERLSAGGLANVQRHFSFAAAGETLDRLLADLLPAR